MAVAGTVLLSACGRGSYSFEPREQDPPSVVFVPRDTIGQMYGDSYHTFGAIAKAQPMPDGGIAVLDQTACTLRLFDSLGVYQRSVGGRGSGPGEFLFPTSFAFLRGGGLAVSDWTARTVWVFDDSLNIQGNMGQFDPGPPSIIEPAGEGCFIGEGMHMESGGNGLEGESFLGLWSDSSAPDVIYHSSPLTISLIGEDQLEIGYQRVVFDSDSAGNVYLAQVSDSSYSIRGFRGTGEPFLQIDVPWERIPRSGAELALEESLSEGDSGHREISPFRNAIEGLFVSGSHEIWVREGSSLHPVFTVYSSSGEPLYRAEVPSVNDSLFSLQFSSNGSMLMAWDRDPLDYPKVILFSPDSV